MDCMHVCRERKLSVDVVTDGFGVACRLRMSAREEARSPLQPHPFTTPSRSPPKPSLLTRHSLAQCDEAHPTCRNCQKSKRECLGYDPIFKPTIGPAQIQPAPSVASQSASVPATAPPPAIAYSNIPQGYAPAASAGYAPGIAACIPPSAPSTDSAYEYSAIDPALAGADSNGMSIPPPPYNSSHALGHDLKSGLGGAGPYPPAPSEGQNPRGMDGASASRCSALEPIHPSV